MNARKPINAAIPGIACAILFTVIVAGNFSLRAEYFLFTSFRGNGESGLHLLLSTNGYHWITLNDDKPFLKPEIGYKLLRDPCIAQGPDGVFHLVWTTGWRADRGRSIGYAKSTNLIHWEGQRAIYLMQEYDEVLNLWAPELFYNHKTGEWLIFWSSTVPSKYQIVPGDDMNHRIYYTKTRDFTNFTPSKIFFDPGYNVIDATLLEVNGKYYLFFKDERKIPEIKKCIKFAVADNPEGPFKNVSEPITGNWCEGPSAIKIGDEYLVYYDHYTRGVYYGAVRSKNLINWEDCSKEMSFPPGHKHGTIIRIQEDLAIKLLQYRSD